MTTQSQAQTKSELTTQMQKGFAPLEQLWSQTNDITEIHGLDPGRVSQVKENITQAYESMREAQRVLQDS